MLSTSPYPEAPAPDPNTPAPSQPASPSDPWTGQAAATTPLYPREPEQPNWSAGTDGVPPALPPGYGVGHDGRRRRPSWRSALVVAALVLALAGGIGIGRLITTNGISIGGQTVLDVPSNVTTLQATLERVAAAAKPSVVEITSSGQAGEAIGSGDIITKNGYIVTNDHVVDGFNTFVVTLQNGTNLPATLVGADPTDDLAVVKVNANNLTPITIADSSKVTVGEYVVAIGTPLGHAETATFGNVSALNRTESESDGPAAVLTGLIQESAPITNGNSGGALVNLQGQLIGMPTLGDSSQQAGVGGSATTVGFAIPSNTIKTVAESIISTGKAPASTQGFLGIQGQDVTPFVAAQYGL